MEIKILTNHWGQLASPAWRAATTFIPPKGDGLFSSFLLAIRLYLRRVSFGCIVLGAGRSDLLFSIIQSLTPRKKIPCVMIDCLWYKHPNALRHLLHKLALKIASRSVDRFVVWASREIDSYSEAFGVAKSKFVFVPYHVTLEGLDIQPCEGDYIFSGGNFGRDYETLIRAADGLPVRLLIGCTRPELFAGMVIPKNVEIRGYSHREFIQKMAGSRLNVVSLASGLLHSGGQQTFLNSMWLGKATIVNDPEGARDYIQHGEDGFLVPPNDPVAMRKAIMMLIERPEKAKEIGAKAMQTARKYSADEHFRKIINVVHDVLKDRMKEVAPRN